MGLTVLAYAEAAPSSDTYLAPALIAVSSLTGIALLAFILMVIAKKQRRTDVSYITTFSLFWALAAAGMVLFAINQWVAWKRDYNLQVQSGYADPQALHEIPAFPWFWATGLALVYLVLLIWSLYPKRQASVI